VAHLEFPVSAVSSRSVLGRLPAWLQWTALCAIEAGVGYLMASAHIPAAYFLGPMMVAIAFAVLGGTVRLPRLAFHGGQSVIGLLAAQSISTAVLLSLLQSWPIMLFATFCTIALSLLVGVSMVRFGSLPGSTAIWGSAPGGASAMISMAEEQGADARIVATMQYVRVVCVVLVGAIVSHALGLNPGPVVQDTAQAVARIDGWSLAGCLAVIGVGLYLRNWLPAGALLIPLILGAILHSSGFLEILMPKWLTVTAMAAIGSYVGLRFDRPTVLYVLKRLPGMILCSMLLVGLCAVLAFAISLMLGKDYLTLYLATSPGGLDSLAIIAVESKADVSLVVAMQALRLFTVILVGPFLLKWVISRTSQTC
jgi:membrane AbrB-like protein